MTFYNEIDPFAAEWLRQLISGGHIADGIVDERSIVEIEPDELRGYTQCHFFAGIGGWSYALRLAGVPDDFPVWTGSCPCQPFSSAGKQRAADDERHLWPAFFRLIRECRPGIVFGEQVAGHAGYAWWDAVATDLESEDYAVAAADLGAHSVGAPHIRQRLYWVAHADNERRLLSERHTETQPSGPTHGPAEQRHDTAGCGEICGMVAHASGQGHPKFGGRREQPTRSSETDNLDHWGRIIWLPCSDGKTRPTQSGLFPLAYGIQPCLVRCGHIEAEAIQEVLDAGIDPDPRKALQAVWQSVQATLHERPIGGPECFPQAQVLLSFLLSLRAACDTAAYGRGGPQADKAVHWRALRFLRVARRPLHPSRGRQPAQQRLREPSDAVQILSLNLARHAEAYRVAAQQAHAATDRVGRLRGYGNAIVPQVAACFVETVMGDA